MHVKFFLTERPDLFRRGYQNQAISSLELGQVCEGPVTHPYPEFLGSKRDLLDI